MSMISEMRVITGCASVFGRHAWRCDHARRHGCVQPWRRMTCGCRRCGSGTGGLAAPATDGCRWCPRPQVGAGQAVAVQLVVKVRGVEKVAQGDELRGG